MSDHHPDSPAPARPDVFLPEASAQGLASALAWLEGLAERDAWPARTLFALTLCADEALTNVLAHAVPAPGVATPGVATRGHHPLQLRLECTRTDVGLALRIEDTGPAFDPTAQTSPELATSLDDARVGGHGLRLMRHYLHSLDYQRVNGRNVLLLVAAWAA